MCQLWLFYYTFFWFNDLYWIVIPPKNRNCWKRGVKRKLRSVTLSVKADAKENFRVAFMWFRLTIFPLVLLDHSSIDVLKSSEIVVHCQIHFLANRLPSLLFGTCKENILSKQMLHFFGGVSLVHWLSSVRIDCPSRNIIEKIIDRRVPAGDLKENVGISYDFSFCRFSPKWARQRVRLIEFVTENKWPARDTSLWARNFGVFLFIGIQNRAIYRVVSLYVFEQLFLLSYCTLGIVSLVIVIVVVRDQSYSGFSIVLTHQAEFGGRLC